ncbi:MAG: GNAT family N-acetyltransferase [Thermoanaerobaculia bacterium]|nr:GNAT family N-acetyltransferase [Thermoanaerobaculia bacterium]
MSAEPAIVAAADVSAADLLELTTLSLGESPHRTREFWRWKHEASPFGASPGLAAVAGGRPVGVRMLLRWRWVAGASGYAAVRAVDTATHPEFRRRGLFRRLTLTLLEKLEAEGVDFVFNTPNPQSRAGYLKMGWVRLGRLPVRVRPRLGGGSGGDAPPGPGGSGALKPVRELLSLPGLPAFLEGVSAGEQRRLSTPRDVDYLRWRYEAVPGYVYGASWRLEASRGAVLIAREGLRRGRRELLVSELLVSDEAFGRASATALLRSVLGSSRARYALVSTPPATAAAAAAARAGFLPPLPLGPDVVYRPLAIRDRRPDLGRGVAAWGFSLGDLEVF